jgi:hypothetical protein
LVAAIAQQGYVFVQAPAMRTALAAAGELSDWPVFVASWNDLAVDVYMADGGRYRRRRHAVYTVDASGEISLQAHQPHYQSLHYNPLNGGIERWFEPIIPEIANGACLRTVLAFCRHLFGSLSPDVRHWHVEVHQFRIEARVGEQGLPTPEGQHRDGVDHVCVLLVQRVNIAQGTTTVHALNGETLGSFTLTQPLDSALVDDTRVLHGVTPVEPLDPSQLAYRDVLVVTFRRRDSAATNDS